MKMPQSESRKKRGNLFEAGTIACLNAFNLAQQVRIEFVFYQDSSISESDSIVRAFDCSSEDQEFIKKWKASKEFTLSLTGKMDETPNWEFHFERLKSVTPHLADMFGVDEENISLKDVVERIKGFGWKITIQCHSIGTKLDYPSNWHLWGKLIRKHLGKGWIGGFKSKNNTFIALKLKNALWM
eukprot:GHVP01007261.1.p1 GENE.GHVP01007261.1~~GHVP01007261.1.p1  ORF type:complete len:191 (+),score=41.94 GHVP01007261.1:23-574(+)